MHWTLEKTELWYFKNNFEENLSFFCLWFANLIEIFVCFLYENVGQLCVSKPDFQNLNGQQHWYLFAVQCSSTTTRFCKQGEVKFWLSPYSMCYVCASGYGGEPISHLYMSRIEGERERRRKRGRGESELNKKRDWNHRPFVLHVLQTDTHKSVNFLVQVTAGD